MKKIFYTFLLVCPLLFIASCEKEKEEEVKEIYQLGDIAEGGIVFYLNNSGTNGLIAALEDLSGEYQWGCHQVNVDGASGVSIGSGYQNTLDIVSFGCQTSNGGLTAAAAARNYQYGSYNDWYLPSKFELVEMYNSIGGGGNFDDDWYWSSSEQSINNYYSAWGVFFDDGDSNFYYTKTTSGRVRPIRSF